jgi:predicted Abi (CAAX) family protease
MVSFLKFLNVCFWVLFFVAGGCKTREFSQSTALVNATNTHEHAYEWAGTLILPKVNFVGFENSKVKCEKFIEIEGERRFDGGIFVLLHSVPAKYDFLRGQKVWLRYKFNSAAARQSYESPWLLNCWKFVSPLESLAGQNSKDVLKMMFENVNVIQNLQADKDLPILEISSDPVQISGFERMLVRIMDNPKNLDVKNLGLKILVQHYNKYDGGKFSGRKEIVYLNLKNKNQKTPKDLFLYGERNSEGVFIASGMEPKTPFLTHWPENQQGLLLHLEKSASNVSLDDSAHPLFAFGYAKVGLDKITGELKFDLTYKPISIHSANELYSGSYKWNYYMGDFKKGRMWNYSVSNVIIKNDILFDSFQLKSVPLSVARGQPQKGLNGFFDNLEILAAKCRVESCEGTVASASENQIIASLKSVMAFYFSLQQFTDLSDSEFIQSVSKSSKDYLNIQKIDTIRKQILHGLKFLGLQNLLLNDKNINKFLESLQESATPENIFYTIKKNLLMTLGAEIWMIDKEAMP